MPDLSDSNIYPERLGSSACANFLGALLTDS